MKKILFFTLLLLIILSIHNDFNRNQTTNHQETQYKFSEILHIKVKQGDTILSITEEMNEQTSLNSQQVINDFNLLNPGTQPDKLMPNQLYYFPLYNKDG